MERARGIEKRTSTTPSWPRVCLVSCAGRRRRANSTCSSRSVRMRSSNSSRRACLRSQGWIDSAIAASIGFDCPGGFGSSPQSASAKPPPLHFAPYVCAGMVALRHGAGSEVTTNTPEPHGRWKVKRPNQWDELPWA